LLDGRRATTHWGSCDEFARNYPTVTVDPDPIFVRDGNVYTSAGVTGFGTVETLRRVFGRRLHVTPSDYRSRFASGATAAPVPTVATHTTNVIPIRSAIR
jgi:transcriptional regulator GlxA family with amidase domain